MSDLRDLYQEVILDHSRNPRNFGKPPAPTHRAEGYNPLCGDRIELYLELDGDTIRNASFEGSGCAISTASASLMTESLKGRSVAEARALFGKVHAMLTGHDEQRAGEGPDVALGKLAVFEGVRQYPVRVKCASLPWHTLKNALEGKSDEVAVTE
ncbi:MAG: SUF system NifU family Fe-S cluster assembly protein [Candidatus Dadabacteria bacterium]|nr:MAG: SUF system NifU family Fe-S cluster assembly protein [Candidatus Dadabacteria bacterium]